MSEKTYIALALGSNLGNASETFSQACALLRAAGLEIIQVADIITTAPVDCPPGTPDFANSALTAGFEGTPEALLQITQSIEQQLGRPADHGFHEARTLDLDIILFGNEIVSLPRLIIPHPRAQERRFVLEPLAQIAPEWVFPDSLLTVEAALKHLA